MPYRERERFILRAAGGVIVTTCLLIAAIEPCSAGAVCAKVTAAKTGYHSVDNCSDAPAANREYILVKLAGRVQIAGDEYCVKVSKPATEDGEYANNKCSEDEPGSEWIRVTIPNAPPRFLPPIKPKFSIKGGSTDLYDHTNKVIIACTSNEGKGEVTGETTLGKILLTYHGCTGTKDGEKCTVKSEGASAEEINTKELTGDLGNVKVSEAESEAGVDLEPSGTAELMQLTGTCVLPCPSMVSGNVIGEIPKSALLEEGSKEEIVFSELSESQKIKKLEGAEDILTVFGSEGALSSSEELTFEEEVAIS